MISFRFYLVSLVAIFLAVALGVAIGSTFAEPRLIENLRGQLDTVEGRLDERVARIDEMGAEIEQLEAYVEQNAPFSVEDRIAGQRVLVVAEAGTDGDTVERLVGRLRQGGAHTDGIVWIEEAWGSVAGAEDLAEDLGASVQDPGLLAEVAWDELLDAAASSGTTPAAPAEESTGPTGGSGAGESGATPVPLADAPAVSTLDDAGWIRVQGIDLSADAPPPASEPAGLTVVLVTSPGADRADGGRLITGLARRGMATGVPTMVGEVWADVAEGEEVTPRASQLQLIREDPELATEVATIDDLDLVQGQVAAVLVVGDLLAGDVGHYGYGPGADRVVPPWLGP